jgi:hypothetical protein
MTPALAGTAAAVMPLQGCMSSGALATSLQLSTDAVGV